jgi:hypothetical protein
MRGWPGWGHTNCERPAAQQAQAGNAQHQANHPAHEHLLLTRVAASR